MGFPLDIRTDLFVGGTWQDISADVYLREVKNLVRGLRDMGSTADPSSLTLTLDNRAGKYSPRNAMSPLFGLIGRNTPVRVSLPSEDDNYLQLDGRTGTFASAPDTAALDITGDIDVRAEISPDWYGSNSQFVLGKWDRASLQQSWLFHIGGIGEVYFRFSASGDEYATGRAFWSLLPTLPERAAIRAVLTNSGQRCTFYWSESLDGPWTEIEELNNPDGPAAIYSGSAPLTIGGTDLRNGIARGRYPLNGRGYRFEVRNGVNGTVVASPDFRAATPGASTLMDSSGLTWTLNGSAEIRDREDRFVGEVADWPIRWSTDDADRYAPITATGILRRLGQGAKALDSTLRRRIPSGNPIAYWPMEEQDDAVQAYSPIPGVLPASVSSVEWASWSTLPSSAPLPKLTGTSSLSATVPAATPGQWHVEMVYTADDNPPIGTDVELLKIYSADGTIRRWEISVRSGRATVRGYTSANAMVIEKFINVGADIFHGWVRLRFYAADRSTGGLFDWVIAWQDVGGEAGLYASSWAGTCGSVSLLAADWPALTEGWGVGHLAVLPEAGSTLYTGSDNAYRGEDAVGRMRRLAQEESLSLTRTPGRLPVAAVGFQRQSALVDLFEAAADGDGGLLTEDMRRIGLHYRDRSSMYTQEPLLTLSYTAPGLGPDIEPVDDDRSIMNDVTVTRDGGSSARAVLADGPLSVQPAPDGIGKYDASYTVSLAEDSQVEPVAYWKLHLGTWDGARYPSVSLMLHKPGAEWLIPLVMRMREGDKIRLTDLPEWVSHDDVDLLVMGWTERLDMYRWDLELNCVPAGPWNTAITDHATFGKADTDSSVVGVAMTSSATSMLVRTVEGPQWTDDAEFLPYDVRVSGEVMQVTAVSDSVADTFSRTTSNGWGTANSGQAWSSAGGVAADFFTQGTDGVQAQSTRTSRITYIPAPSADLTVQGSFATDALATGDPHYGAVMARYQSSNGDRYLARLQFNTNQTLTLGIVKQVAGVQTVLGGGTVPGTHAAGRYFTVKFSLVGASLSAKAWQVGTDEPDDWQVTATDSSIGAAGAVGFRTIITGSNTNTLPLNFLHSEIEVTDVQTFTVVRAQNGVTKAQAAGEAVNIANPAITSL